VEVKDLGIGQVSWEAGRLGPPDLLFTDKALARYQGLTKAQSSLLT
jgi:hypothetical protein